MNFAQMLLTPVTATKAPPPTRKRNPNVWVPSGDLCSKYKAAMTRDDMTLNEIAAAAGITRDRADRQMPLLLETRKVARNKEKVRVPGASKTVYTYRWIGD